MTKINVKLDKKAKEVVAKTANIGGDTPTPTPTKKLYQYTAILKDGSMPTECESPDFYFIFITEYQHKFENREDLLDIIRNDAITNEAIPYSDYFGDNVYNVSVTEDDRLILISEETDNPEWQYKVAYPAVKEL